MELDGKFIKRYDSAADTEKDGFHNADVLLCCKGRIRTCHKRQFMFEDEYMKHGGKQYEKPVPNGMKAIIQCDLEGNFIKRFDSVKEA